ncbi:translocation/assembly module TamB, partial [bacterium]
ALAVRAEEGSLGVGLAGGFFREDTRWSGEIRTLALENEETGAWNLADAAQLTASPDAAALSGFCWVSEGGARLCAEGAWAQAGPWSASGTIADLPFSLFEPLLPPDLEITGDVDGTFAGQGSPAGVVTADVDLRPGPGEIRYPLESGETAAVRFEQGEVVLDAGAQGVTGRAALTFVDTGTLRADLRLPQYNTLGAPLQQQNLNGRIVADFRDLGLVEAFVPDLESPQGTLTADLRLGGTVAEPRLTGAASLEGQVNVPRYGLELRDIDLTAQAEGDEPFALRGDLRSGGGTLTLAGVAARDGRPARLSIQGSRVLAADTPELRVVVSPDLEAVLEGNLLSVAGEVVVPEAEIVQQDREAAIPVSKDVIIVSGEDEVAEQGGQALEISARIRVILGEDVEVRASGFAGEVEGSLLVIEQPGRPTLGTGELVVENGVYKAYGQSLTIDRGRLIFAGGPIDNPGLDLRAFREADDGTIAGINVQGTLESPQTTLYSDPPMAQSEALAYLLLGRPLGQATPEEGDLLANAADTLGLKGGNLLAKRLAARFGLEEARVESEGGLEEARLVVGRYLSPRLYVTYGVGLFEPVNLLRLRYILGRDWSVQVETGEETRADVLYNVERGRGAGATPR